MTTTTARAPADSTARTRAGTVAAMASALFALVFLLTTLSVNVPWKAGDQTVLDWWQQSGNLNSSIYSEFFAISAAVLFVVVINYIRTLVAGTGMVQWSAFAHSMGTAFSCLLLVTSALRGVIGHMVQFYDDPQPGIDVLRYSTALNYTLLGSAAMTTLAMAIFAVSVIVIRTDALRRWVGYLGLVCSSVILVVVAIGLGGLATPAGIVWALCLAVAIWRQPSV